MIANPFISIVIPTYNDCENLIRNIENIKKQEFKNFEIIVINDCSTDQTKDYLDLLNDNQVLSFHSKKNKGPGYARNKGIELSKGNWISFLDSDDSWNDSRLKIISDYLIKNNDLDMICHNEYEIDKLNNKKRKLYYGSLDKLNSYKDLLLNGNKFSTSATIVKKKFLKENNVIFNEKRGFFSVEDYDFWLKCMINNPKFEFMESFLGYYHVHENNITKNILIHKKNYLRVLYNHIFHIQNFESDKILLWKDVYIKYNCELAVIYLKYFKNKKKFLYILLRCFKKNPLIVIKFILKKIFFI